MGVFGGGGTVGIQEVGRAEGVMRVNGYRQMNRLLVDFGKESGRCYINYGELRGLWEERTRGRGIASTPLRRP
jgi:hypothetical protein